MSSIVERQTLREDAEAIVRSAIERNLPGPAVRLALAGFQPPRGRLVLVAIGKAAWDMAHAASEVLGEQLHAGLVITKYEHVKGPIAHVVCREAGHPVVDEASVAATREAEALVRDLGPDDLVLFLVSGAGVRSLRIPRYHLQTSRTSRASSLRAAPPSTKSTPCASTSHASRVDASVSCAPRHTCMPSCCRMW